MTAPLRRLVDRFASEVCVALCSGEEIPAWVTDNAEEVIATMHRTSQLSSQVEKAVLNWLEATVLQPWIGHNFEAIVLSSDKEKNKASVFVLDPSSHGRHRRHTTPRQQRARVSNYRRS